MTDSRLARDHGLRLSSVDDAFKLIGRDLRPIIFTTGDLSDGFFDLHSQIAGDIFQKLIKYNCKVAIVIPDDHNKGERITELKREHLSHPVVRFFNSIEDALLWQD